MAPPDPTDTSAWLRDSAWLQRLTRRLARDDGDDLAQETFLLAWQRPPRGDAPWHAWLAGLARNLTRNLRRQQARQTTRLAQLPAPLPVDDSARMAERIELHQRLLIAVRELDEPYRSTIWLRFLDELPVDAIAARMQAPPKTVRTRIDRGLAQLRERLDQSFGNRHAWLGLVALDPLRTPPLANPPTASPTTPAALPGFPAAAPILAMGTLLKWTAPAAAICVVGYFALQTMLAPEPMLGERQTTAAAATPATGATGAGESVLPGTTDRAAATPTVPAAATAPEIAASRLHGVVMDLARHPVGGLEVRAELLRIAFDRQTTPPERIESTLAAADGTFALPLLHDAVRLVADGRGYATVLGPTVVGALPPVPPIVFVGPARQYCGVVQDAMGAPLAGAEVAVYLAPELGRDLAQGPLVGTLPIVQAITDPAGRFTLPALGFAPGNRLAASLAGYLTERRPLPDASDLAMVVTLRPRGPESARLEGRVEQSDGRAAANAWVSAGDATAKTDEDGRFALDPVGDLASVQLVAGRRGNLPARLDLASVPEAQHRDLLLVLGRDALEITGTVHDATGHAIDGALVWTPDGERFGAIETKVGPLRMNLSRELEQLLGGVHEGQADGRERRTDAVGMFRLTGLVDRDYRVLVMHPDTLEVAGPFECRAGQREVELTLPDREAAQPIGGRVTNVAGKPLPGASLRLGRRRMPPGNKGMQIESARTVAAVTDADGAFRIAELPIADRYLIVSLPDGGGMAELDLSQVADPQHVQVVLPQACYLQVEVRVPEHADSLTILDADGKPVQLQFQLGGVQLMSTALSLNDGSTERLRVDERAKTLVLQRKGSEVARIPLQLRAGEVTTVRW
jgi:RNA polymerase sigma-70 factor (ECF subfamily)